MPLPQRIPNSRVELVSFERMCSIARRWGLDVRVVELLARAQSELPFDLWLFSGARSREKQETVSSLAFDRSTHADMDTRGCPRLATGADAQPVSPAVRMDRSSVAQMGAAFVRAGLRWGGGAAVDDVGIPVGVERWHVDLGARQTHPR